MSAPHPRLLAADVCTAELEPCPFDPDSVQAGTPHTSDTALVRLGATCVGLWQITEGTVVDVEVDEVFVVVCGDATLTFHTEGGRSCLELAPGVVVLLKAGDRTMWEIRTTLRKIYIAAPASPSPEDSTAVGTARNDHLT